MSMDFATIHLFMMGFRQTQSWGLRLDESPLEMASFRGRTDSFLPEALLGRAVKSWNVMGTTLW